MSKLIAMQFKIEAPYRRYAIRARCKDGVKLWLTDDGLGCDESLDFTSWGAAKLVTHVERPPAIFQCEQWRKWARARGMNLRVVPVWEYPGGIYKQDRQEKL
jgi:hypothetical protein